MLAKCGHDVAVTLRQIGRSDSPEFLSVHLEVLFET